MFSKSYFKNKFNISFKALYFGVYNRKWVYRMQAGISLSVAQF